MANRRKQIEAIQAKASELSDELDILVMDLQESFDNTPESIQNSERGETMQERIDTLTEWRDQLSDMAEAEA